MGREKKTRIVKAGGRTYFFDFKESQNGQKFLVLTESRWAKGGNEYLRSSILLFPEQAKEFSQVLREMAARLV